MAYTVAAGFNVFKVSLYVCISKKAQYKCCKKCYAKRKIL